MHEQGISAPTVVTLCHRGEAVGRGIVGQGAIDIVPETPIGRDSLVTAFEQDKALAAQKAARCVSLPSVRRPAAAKLQAWIVTGPLGHLWSALADMTVIWARYLAHRARRG